MEDKPQSEIKQPTPTDRFKPISIDSGKRAYEKIRFFPISLLDAAIIAFLGVALILAIIWDQSTLSATIAGVFGGYIKAANTSSTTNNTTNNH